MRRFILKYEKNGLYAEWKERTTDGVQFKNHIVLDLSESDYFNENGMYRSIGELLADCDKRNYLFRNCRIEWIDAEVSE